MRTTAEPSPTWLASYALGLASARPHEPEQVVGDVLVAAGANATVLELAWRALRTWSVADEDLAERALDVLEAAALEVMGARRHRPAGVSWYPRPAPASM